MLWALILIKFTVQSFLYTMQYLHVSFPFGLISTAWNNERFIIQLKWMIRLPMDEYFMKWWSTSLVKFHAAEQLLLESIIVLKKAWRHQIH